MMKDQFKNAFFQETTIYFLCEDTFSIGHKDPIIMNFCGNWAKDLLPLVKLSILTLKMAEAETSGLPFPIPGVGQLERFQYFDDLVIGDEVKETLWDMEQWFGDIVNNGKSMMEGHKVARIRRLVSSAYVMLSQIALQEENLQKWQTSMITDVIYDDNEQMCHIKWVKI
jgi:hypothetical protein